MTCFEKEGTFTEIFVYVGKHKEAKIRKWYLFVEGLASKMLELKLK